MADDLRVAVKTSEIHRGKKSETLTIKDCKVGRLAWAGQKRTCNHLRLLILACPWLGTHRNTLLPTK